MAWIFDRIGERALPSASQYLGISIYSAGLDPDRWDSSDLDRVCDDLWARISRTASELVVYACEPARFNAIIHERYVRFSTGKSERLVGLDSSLDAFEQTVFVTPCRFTYEVLSDASAQDLRDQEQRIQRLVGNDKRTRPLS